LIASAFGNPWLSKADWMKSRKFEKETLMLD